MILQLAYRSIKKPIGIVKDVLIKAGKFIFPMDFIVQNFKEDKDVSLILGMPFLYTTKAQFDVYNSTITLHVGDEKYVFDLYKVYR